MSFINVKIQEQQQQPEELQEEEEQEHEDSLSLCQRCKELDLDRIFNGPCLDLDPGSEMVLSLGVLDKDSRCGLCRFFYSMRRPSVTGETTGLYHLRKYRFDTYYHGWRLRDSTLWAVDAGSGCKDRKKWGGVAPSLPDLNDKPYLCFLPQSTQPRPYPERTLKGLPVSETYIFYPLLRYWINVCEGHPNCSYLNSDLGNSRSGPVIRGVDCTSRKIVDLQPGDKYIALSYVWGHKPLVENKGGRVLPTKVSKVIEDAMVVVKKLGYRYLWVDQYCINQHDDQDKHAQIKNMDRVYEGSHATIVAFSGLDSSSGLPGVSSTPRIPQPRFTGSRVTLVGFTPSITRPSSEASIWVKRGWTFQEAHLSRRLLIFTQEQVYFLCSRGWWVESCTPRRRMIGERNTSNGSKPFLHRAEAPMTLISPLTRSPVSKCESQLRVRITRLLDLIGGFTRRQLSFQLDALDAVRGLLSRVPVLSYWGIPVYDFRENRKGGFAVNASKADALFLEGLSWQPDGTATGADYLGRRTGFPSWSWLGWRILATFRHYRWPKKICSTVRVENNDGTLLSISNLVELYGAEVKRSRMLPERTTYLWLEGLVLGLGFQPGSRRHGGEMCFCLDHPLGCSDDVTEGSCAAKCDHVRVKVSFRMNVKGSEDMLKRTLKRKWTCLLIIESYTISTAIHDLLILDEGDDAAYCVGTFSLKDRASDRSILEKLKAKVPHEYRKVRIG